VGGAGRRTGRSWWSRPDGSGSKVSTSGDVQVEWELMCRRHRCAYTQEARRELISTGSSSHTQGPMPGTSGSPLDAQVCISHPLSILPRGHPLPSPPRSPHAATKRLSPSASPRQPQLPTTTNDLPALASPSPRDAAAHRVPTSPPRNTHVTPTIGQLPPSRVVHLGSGVANPQLSHLHAANPLSSPPSTPRAVRHTPPAHPPNLLGVRLRVHHPPQRRSGAPARDVLY